MERLQPNLPWDDYLALPGVSITRLKELGRSPLHYQHRLLNPKESAPLTLGRAAHCAVLEPERYQRDHVVWSRRTSAGNLAPRNGKHWDAFKAAAEGLAILTEDEHAEALAIQRAVRSNPDAMRYLASGDAEVTMQWSMLGHACKGRLDFLTTVDGRPWLVGLKTARDCRSRQFGRQAANLGYHLQWAYYQGGYKAITGHPDPGVIEIVVEAEAPHAVAVYEIPEEVLQQGFEEYTDLLQRLDECVRNDNWPGPEPGIQTLTLPSWVYGEEEISYVE